MFGFTLVEMIIAIAVLAVLASLAAPSFVQALDNRRLSGAAEEAKNAMLFARSEALKRGTPVCLFMEDVSNAAGEPWLRIERDCGTACEINGDGCLMQAPLDRFTGVTAAGDLVQARFDPVLGTAEFIPLDTKQSREITLTSARDSRLEVQLNIMGRARICAPTGGQGVLSLGYRLCQEN